jgi:hypothetical protein
MSTIIQDISSGLPVYFLGGTVLSFNSSIGYGSQQESTLNVDLIEDCDSGQSIDITVGAPAYFTAKSFSFGGIISSWGESQSTSGRVHNVKLVDPRQLLENVVVIVDSYRGPIDSAPNTVNYTAVHRGLNFFNVYAYFEDATSIVNGEFNDCNVFGSSQVNDQGMPYYRILQGLSLMGPVIYSSTNDPFIVDFTTWPAGLPEYYRVPGPSITMLQLLQDVCDVLGYDFYVYMTAGNIIKIGLVDLKNEPASFSTVVSQFNGLALDISFGEELRNDITRSMVLGEQVHYLSYANKTLPYFGHDKYNNIMLAAVPHGHDENGFWLAKSVNSLNESLLAPFFTQNFAYTLHELDIRCAMASFQSWLLRAMASNTPGSFNAAIRGAFSLCVNNNPEQVKQLITDSSQFGILQNSVVKNLQDFYHNPTYYRANSFDPSLLEDLETIHRWLADLGNTYYGKQYLVQLDENICFNRTSFTADDINAEGQVVFSSSPTSAGGWSESANIMNLASPELDLFKNEDGRIKCFAKFSRASLACGNLDIENLGDDVISIGSNAWVLADVEEKIYLHRANANEKYRGYVVLRFSSQCVATICDSNSPRSIQFGLAAPLENLKQSISNYISDATAGTVGMWGVAFSETFAPPASIPATISNIGADPMYGIDHQSMDDFGFSPVAVMPEQVVIPMRSNVIAYGPWVSSNFWTSAGGADVSINPDLAPWVFGSLAAVNNVGNTIIEFNKRGLTKAESGSVTVPGLPSSSHGLPTLGSKVASTGPNLTSINFALGTKGATTTYEFKTYTPKFGKLSKLFIDKYKNTYKDRQNQLRLLRAQQANQNKLYRKLANIGNRRSKKTKFNAKHSEGMGRVFVGTMEPWYNNHTGQKITIGLAPLHSVASEATFGYGSKAFMSLDGIFSPVSKLGSGGLPSYEEPEDYDAVSPETPYPPTSEDINDVKNPINATTYDPLMNDPNGGATGHSIDLVGRGDTVPTQGLINSFYAATDNSKYANDYRFIGLRGPLILHSWGYDIEGNPVPAKPGSDPPIFIDDVLQKPTEWPVAPIDLRLDKKRGVWITPQPYKIICAILEEKLPASGTASAKITNEKESKNDKIIEVIDKLGQSLPKETKIYAYFDPVDEKYIVLEASEQPAIITGTANSEFTPTTNKNISITIKYTSGFKQEFVDKVITAQNPLGFGACEGDMVTAHLYAESQEEEEEYIIHSTGKNNTYNCCS